MHACMRVPGRSRSSSTFFFRAAARAAVATAEDCRVGTKSAAGGRHLLGPDSSPTHPPSWGTRTRWPSPPFGSFFPTKSGTTWTLVCVLHRLLARPTYTLSTLAIELLHFSLCRCDRAACGSVGDDACPGPHPTPHEMSDLASSLALWPVGVV